MLVVSKSALIALPAVALQVIPACTCDGISIDGANARMNATELARPEEATVCSETAAWINSFMCDYQKLLKVMCAGIIYPITGGPPQDYSTKAGRLKTTAHASLLADTEAQHACLMT